MSLEPHPIRWRIAYISLRKYHAFSFTRAPVLSQPLLDTQLEGLSLVRRGKVRDVYAAGDALILVATDRISAFDYVLGSGIPDKGRVLTQLSAFWFERTRHIVPNHVLSTNVAENPARNEMECFLEWHVIHRTPQQMRTLAPGRAHPDDVALKQDVLD